MKDSDRICVGMINDGSVDATLVLDLIQIAKVRNSGFDSYIQVQGKGQITRNRNKVVQEFLSQTDAQWLLFIDSDERLTKETWQKLRQSADDRTHKVVSALVFADFETENGDKRPLPTIYHSSDDEGFSCIDDYPLDSLIEIAGSGTGCLLIHRSVFLLIQENASPHQGKDWCWFVEGAINGRYFGEDLLFSRRLQQLGVKMYAHTGAICAHHKDYWLDDRHHAHIREAVIKSKLQSASELPLGSDAPSTKEK